MRIFDASDTQTQSACLWDLLPAAAEERLVERTAFIAAEFHGFPPERDFVLLCFSLRPDGGLNAFALLH
jgi:hypothetical protein